MGVNSEKSAAKSSKIRKTGNELFLQNNPNNYRMVLSLYTKSIAYAPLNSEELALGFGNRSALWFHMKKYDLCLIDVGRALSITKSNDLVDKLSSRREECLNHVSPTAEKEQKKLKPLNITPSKSTPCGADSIMVECNKKYGRHYVATRNIRPGEIVMSEKISYASVDIGQMYLVCAHCLAFAWAGIPCDTCIFTIYCSEACKKEAWSQYHDILCELYSIDPICDRLLHNEQEYGLLCKSGDPATDIFLTMMRLLILFIKKEGLQHVIEVAQGFKEKNELVPNQSPVDPTKASCADLKYLCSLMPNTEEDIEVNIIPMLEWAFRKSQKIDLEAYDDISLASLKVFVEELDAIILLNAFKYSALDCCCKDSEFSDCISHRGTVFAPCSALFNHACDNNVDRFFLPGPRVIFITNRPIKKGEQLFVCYGPNASLDKSMRRMALQGHSFTCQCTACVENWPVTYDANRDKAVDAVMEMVRSEHDRLLGKAADRFIEAPMAFNEKFFDASRKILEYIYKNFKGRNTWRPSYIYKRYMYRYLHNLYGEDDLNLRHMSDSLIQDQRVFSR